MHIHVHSVRCIWQGLLFSSCQHSADSTNLLHKKAAFSACTLLHSDQNTMAGVCLTRRQQIQCSSHSSAAETKSQPRCTGGCALRSRRCRTPVSHCCGCLSLWAVPSCLHPSLSGHSCKRHQVHTLNAKQQLVVDAYLFTCCDSVWNALLLRACSPSTVSGVLKPHY